MSFESSDTYIISRIRRAKVIFRPALIRVKPFIHEIEGDRRTSMMRNARRSTSIDDDDTLARSMWLCNVAQGSYYCPNQSILCFHIMHVYTHTTYKMISVFPCLSGNRNGAHPTRRIYPLLYKTNLLMCLYDTVK